MLSPKSAEIINATLPVVGSAIGEITKLFYQKMFAAHPEFEKDLFNRGNQAGGEQPRALAGSIAAFATVLVESEAPSAEDILSRIANKHASLGVTENQYPIVYEHLFAAIAEILGEAVTPEVAEAWTEVYWLMADALVALERKLYQDSGVSEGDVWRKVIVKKRILESADTVSYVLSDPNGKLLPDFKPGQYISVSVELPDGAKQKRQYSLMQADQAGDWRISVKRILKKGNEPAGEVSNYLYQNIFELDQLEVSIPFGELTLKPAENPLLLVSAGIGCTPIVGMLNHLVQQSESRPVVVIHADRSPSDHAHRQELQELVDKLPQATLHNWYEDLGQKIESEAIKSGRVNLEAIDLAPDTHAYLCGPVPFMESMRASLLEKDLSTEDIHYEVFGPGTVLKSA
ncbi:MAG: globin domain-containing protein [Mycobacteriaceae bacterium]